MSHHISEEDREMLEDSMPPPDDAEPMEADGMHQVCYHLCVFFIGCFVYA